MSSTFRGLRIGSLLFSLFFLLVLYFGIVGYQHPLAAFSNYGTCLSSNCPPSTLLKVSGGIGEIRETFLVQAIIAAAGIGGCGVIIAYPSQFINFINKRFPLEDTPKME